MHTLLWRLSLGEDVRLDDPVLRRLGVVPLPRLPTARCRVRVREDAGLRAADAARRGDLRAFAAGGGVGDACSRATKRRTADAADTKSDMFGGDRATVRQGGSRRRRSIF